MVMGLVQNVVGPSTELTTLHINYVTPLVFANCIVACRCQCCVPNRRVYGAKLTFVVQTFIRSNFMTATRDSCSRLFKLRTQALPHVRSALRYYSSRETRTHFDDNNPSHHEEEEKEGQSTKPKISIKKKRAQSMVRLINSRPWSSEVESSLSTLSSSVSRTTALQVLQLIKDPAKALHFFNWVQQKGFNPDAQSYFLMLEILGRARNLNTARNLLFSIEKKSNGNVKLEDRFFNSLIRNYGQAGLFHESLKLFNSMKALGVSPSAVTFNSLLLIVLKRGRTQMAKTLFDEMLSTYGVSPDAYTFNILIRGFCKNSLVDDGFRFFSEMLRNKCDPDIVTYNTLVDGLCRAGRVDKAHNVLKGMMNKGKHLNPNVVTYTALVRGYCSKQEVDKAVDVFQEMVDRGVKPNKITYNTLIKGLCETQKIDKLTEILNGALGDGGFIPDTCTFNTLMHAHCNAGNLNGAFTVFEKMRKLKVRPDSATYSVLIRSLCLRGDFERAEQLFDELYRKMILLNDYGCIPLVASYIPMFQFLCENGKTSKADRVFRQLMKRGAQDPSTYNTLILGHCKEGTFQAGYELLVLMLRRNFVPDFEIYESLIDGLLQKGEPVLSQLTLEKMLNSSYLPKTSTFHSILGGLLEKGCARESASLIELMLERNIRQNVNLTTRTARILFQSRLRDKAFDIVGLLYNNGYMVDMEELIGFLCKRRKLLEAHKLLLFCLEKDQDVNTDFCNIVAQGLCKMKKLSEAFRLYYGLVEKGKHQQLSCLEELRVALDSAGRSEEARFVAKRIPN